LEAHLTHIAITTALSAAWFAILRHAHGVSMFPDGVRYLHAGKGNRLHRPFHLRWLLPWLLRDDQRAWHVTTAAATIGLAPAMYCFLLACGLDADAALVGSLLVPSLPGIFRFNVASPFTVDAVALLLTIIAATLFRVEAYAAAVVALVAATVKESSPLFIAALAWHPLALVAFAPVIIRQLASPASPTDIFDERSRDMLARPVHWAMRLHQATWSDGAMMIAPWGVVALGFAALGTPWVAVTVALAYAQTLVATDTVRLYQYAAPAMIYAALTVMPMEYAGVVVVAGLFNPWQRNMI
jgi:hypothetical protein